MKFTQGFIVKKISVCFEPFFGEESLNLHVLVKQFELQLAREVVQATKDSPLEMTRRYQNLFFQIVLAFPKISLSNLLSCPLLD